MKFEIWGSGSNAANAFTAPYSSCADVIIAKAYFIFRKKDPWKERSRNPDFQSIGPETEQVDFRRGCGEDFFFVMI